MCDISRSTACKTGSAKGTTKDSRRYPYSHRLRSKDRGCAVTLSINIPKQ